MPVVKNPLVNTGDARDVGSIHGPGRSPGVGKGYLLQYACLESFTDRGAWWATVHRVMNSQTWLNTCMRARTHTQTHRHTDTDTDTHTHTHTYLLHGICTCHSHYLGFCSLHLLLQGSSSVVLPPRLPRLVTYSVTPTVFWFLRGGRDPSHSPKIGLDVETDDPTHAPKGYEKI